MLRQLLDSLRAQTFDDFEVVVVDDHSEDGSDEEVEKAAADGAPARLVRNPGQGAVAARTAGVTASESEYLAFIDSDCVLAPIVTVQFGAGIRYDATIGTQPPDAYAMSNARNRNDWKPAWPRRSSSWNRKR